MTRHKLAIIVVLLFMVAGCSRQPSDREILQRAVVAGKSADAEAREYIFWKIAKAQAKRGYYDDAVQTWKLVDKERNSLFAEIIWIRAKNGDISGAKKMVETVVSEPEKIRCLDGLALAQAERGDVAGAKETVRSLQNPYWQHVLEQNVLWKIGVGQAHSGDLEAALKTASEMERGWSDQILLDVTNKLIAQGDKARARQIAVRITDPDIARRVGRATAAPPSPPPTPCNLAVQDSSSGKFDQAFKRLETAKCDCRTVAYIHEESGDLIGAERVTRSCANPADVNAGMSELARRSAAKGEITTALRLMDAVHVTAAELKQGYLALTCHDIARAWGKKDMKAALKWAQARPDEYERALALLGLAEAMNTQLTPKPPARNSR